MYIICNFGHFRLKIHVKKISEASGHKTRQSDLVTKTFGFLSMTMYGLLYQAFICHQNSLIREKINFFCSQNQIFVMGFWVFQGVFWTLRTKLCILLEENPWKTHDILKIESKWKLLQVEVRVKSKYFRVRIFFTEMSTFCNQYLEM